MPMLKFGHILIDWPRVYMLKPIHLDFDHEPSELLVFAVFPEVKPGEPAITAIKSDARAIWEHAKSDPRFAVFPKHLAIDVSRVIGATLPILHEAGSLWFDLGDDQGLRIPIDANLSYQLEAALAKQAPNS